VEMLANRAIAAKLNAGLRYGIFIRSKCYG